MRNTAKFYNRLLEDVEIDLDSVFMITKVRDEIGEHLLELFFDKGVYAMLEPVLLVDENGEEELNESARDRILSQWRHGHGRPEIVEAFSDTEGPKDGYGREMLDLSTCATFSCKPSDMWGPTITCRFAASKDARSMVFFVKRDEAVTEEAQCAALELLWRKARGETVTDNRPPMCDAASCGPV